MDTKPLVPFDQYVAHSANGTYLAYLTDQATNRALQQYQSSIRLALHLPKIQTVKDDSYHCTILYSKNPVPQSASLPLPTDLVSSCKSLTAFPRGNDGFPIILLLANPIFHHIQQHLITNHGASSDYDSFRPHVTLGYCHDEQIGHDELLARLSRLPLPSFELRFDRIQCKPLD